MPPAARGGWRHHLAIDPLVVGVHGHLEAHGVTSGQRDFIADANSVMPRSSDSAAGSS
jgi:hypothetical protein